MTKAVLKRAIAECQKDAENIYSRLANIRGTDEYGFIKACDDMRHLCGGLVADLGVICKAIDELEDEEG